MCSFVDKTGDEEENDNDGDEDKEVEILEDRFEGEPSETEEIDDEDDKEADEDTQDRDEDTQDRDEDTLDTDEQDSDVEDDHTRGVEDSHGQMTLDKPGNPYILYMMFRLHLHQIKKEI